MSLEAQRTRTRLLPVEVTHFDEPELVSMLLNAIENRRERIVTYATAHTLAEAWRSDDFADAINRTDVCYADGYGVVIAAKAVDGIGLAKVTANDFFLQFSAELIKKGKRIALVGSAPGITEEVGALIERELQWSSGDNQNAAPIYCHSGYMNDEEEEKMLEHLLTWQPHVVFVGMGQPRQEIWAIRAQANLPATLFHCVGGLFDLLSGRIGQPAPWIRRAGFEWLYRLCDRPRQNWRRYLLGIPYVAFRIVWTALTKHAAHSGGRS